MNEKIAKNEKEIITPELVSGLLENAQIVIPEDGVFEKLKSAEEEGKQLRIKMGFDPTSPDLHLGHAVSMRQVKRFQDLGHLPVIIIGDFTGLIGDPSGRSESRPLAGKEELEQNAQSYIEQLGKVVDINNIEVHRNSEWLSGMNLEELIQLLAQGTLSQVISRDDFRKRLDSGSPIALHEIIYPYIQGADSVAVSADIEIGGVDQLYGFQAARMLQGKRGDDPEAAVLMPLLRGLDGVKKMSKSLGNYVGLDDEPRDMFGKLMSIPDTLIEEYLRLASGFNGEEIEAILNDIKLGANPMGVKLSLARNITETYHDEEKANDAQEYFAKQFQNRTAEELEYQLATIPETVRSVVDLIVAIDPSTSKSQARRLIEQGGITIDGNRISDIEASIDSPDGLKVKLGKRRFFQTTTK